MDFREAREFIKDTFGYIIVFLCVLFAVIYGVTFQTVSGISMSPNYNNKDLLLLSKVNYLFEKPDRGDVIALTDKDGVLYIKRIIAIPGDNVYVKDNKLYINKTFYKEDYLTNVVTDDFTFNDICVVNGCEEYVLPENKYFVMGDNREDSFDSRFNVFGLVDREHIIGKVVFKIWPIGFVK